MDPKKQLLFPIPSTILENTIEYSHEFALRLQIEAAALAGRVGAGIQYDQAAQSPFFRYYDADGRQHEVWFEDARSLRAKYSLVNEYGLAGVSFWNLNKLFRTNFILLESMFSVEKVL